MQTRRSPLRTRSARASVAALIGPWRSRSASYSARKRWMTSRRAAASLGLWRTKRLPRTRFLRSMSTGVSPGPGLPGAPARLFPRRMEPAFFMGAFLREVDLLQSAWRLASPYRLPGGEPGVGFGKAETPGGADFVERANGRRGAHARVLRSAKLGGPGFSALREGRGNARPIPSNGARGARVR